ncbi:Signal peptidase complex catalytic subunit SEC11 [Dissostichus eleginoides]|uniref:Signal peptidase complex catalytic subunit SEC11 n=1 Tax=Dissostichus eleginoides TaxID=100907 RepID=A0AAD9BNN7_DISEL|nr:Signal peptidase complex catalytic subunit SEC11 [Dissostichus eleginoides]
MNTHDVVLFDTQGMNLYSPDAVWQEQPEPAHGEEFFWLDGNAQQFQGNDIPVYSEANCFLTNDGIEYYPLQAPVMQSQSLLYPQSNNVVHETAGWFPVENNMLEWQTEAKAPKPIWEETH